MMLLRSPSPYAGFTLIEMIVSLGVFAVVSTITVGALLTLVAANQRFQYEQGIMSNLSFAVDSMAREMRMGFNYFCASAASVSDGVDVDGQSRRIFAANNDHHELVGSRRRNCASGRGSNPVHGISFYEQGDDVTGPTANRILYFYDATTHKIYRRVGNGVPESITSDSIRIVDANFHATNTVGGLFPPGPFDQGQPMVTIFIAAESNDDPQTPRKQYYLQTTVTQRRLDL